MFRGSNCVRSKEWGGVSIDCPIHCSPTKEKKDLEWEKRFNKHWNEGDFDTMSGKSFNPLKIKDFIHSLLSKTKEDMIREMENLIEIERDCIKDGNALTPSEQEIALETLKNIRKRI